MGFVGVLLLYIKNGFKEIVSCLAILQNVIGWLIDLLITLHRKHGKLI